MDLWKELLDRIIIIYCTSFFLFQMIAQICRHIILSLDSSAKETNWATLFLNKSTIATASKVISDLIAVIPQSLMYISGARVSEVKTWQAFVHFIVALSSCNGWLLVRNAPQVRFVSSNFLFLVHFLFVFCSQLFFLQNSLFVASNEHKPVLSAQALNALFSILVKSVKNDETLVPQFISQVLTCPAIIVHLNKAVSSLIYWRFFPTTWFFLLGADPRTSKCTRHPALPPTALRDITLRQNSVCPSRLRSILGRKKLKDSMSNIKLSFFCSPCCLELWKKLGGGSSSPEPLGEVEKETPPTLAAVVCQLYMTALSTMANMKNEIIAGVCREDRILRQLWSYLIRWGSEGRYTSGPSGSPSPLNAALSLLSRPQSPHVAPLMLFADSAAIVISILDEEELYERAAPFPLEELVHIARFCNHFCFRAVWNGYVDDRTSSYGLFGCIHTLCMVLHVRDSRRTFVNDPKFWLAPDVKSSVLMGEFEKKTSRGLLLMRKMSHLISLKERMLLFRKFVSADKVCVSQSSATLITVARNRLVEDGYRQLSMLSTRALKSTIRVKFVNQQGLDEAGIDQDGVFKEFLELTIKQVFDPGLNLFRSTAAGVLYPSSTSSVHEDHLALFQFVGRILAKAVYEGIVVDVQLAPVLLAAMLGGRRLCAFDELSQLDPELYRNLTFVKKYDGDVSDLSLTFSIDEDFMGKINTVDLVPGGRTIQVTNDNKIDYVHRMAHHRVFSQTKQQCRAFVTGAQSVLNPAWLFLFAPYELQFIISGYTSDIDLADLKKHVQYYGGFHGSHRLIKWLWEIVEKDFTPDERRLFLKFVTSCSRPPLLGFSYLEPPFSIRCVEVSDDQKSIVVPSANRSRIPWRILTLTEEYSASTCFNLLKLPNYNKKSVLLSKLRYAIHSETGFELS
ncbi:unnamed protein product [Heligmosomoides polygyrus]|nr:unnamed protein product [Heligmosomoides polygyrus]